MNNDRRKEINKAISLLQEAMSILEATHSEEQEYYDNMPENLQSSERGESAEMAADNLYNACVSVEEAIVSAENAVG